LVSYVDVARTTAKKAAALTVYPNPFSYTSATVPVTIDGLPDEAIITIMASDGMVVRKLETSASRASWDGLDASGRPLNTGVYVIVAKNRKGSERRSGKIIITR
jgi:flagellar hook assembly protein FlgD